MAAKRLLARLNSLYPKRPLCLTGDNLFATKDFVQQIVDKGWSFILTAKPERNKELFSWYDYLNERKQSLQYTNEQGHQHHYEWSYQLPIRQEYKEENYFYVNLLEYTEIGPEGQVRYYNTWITTSLYTKATLKK